MLAAWGLRRVTLIAFGVAIGSNLLLFHIRSVGLIAFFTFLSGFATSILVTAVVTVIRRRAPAEYRGRAMAGVGGSLRFGMFLGPAVGGVLAQRLGVPWVFILRAVVLTAGMLAYAAGSRDFGSLGLQPKTEGPTPETAPAAGRSGRRRWITALLLPLAPVFRGLRGRWYAVATVGFGILILSILRSSREVILPLWGTHIDLSVAEIGLAMSLGAVFDLLLFVPAGIISDRWGRKTSLALCLSLFSLGLLSLLPSRGFLLFVLAGALIGIGNGLGSGINMTTAADLAPENAVSEFLGLWRLYGDLGNAAGPALVGALSAAIALGPTVAVTALLGVLGLGVTALFAPETKALFSGENG